MHTSLTHKNAWELLVATMLSAQSQDAQVNKVTPKLFRKYPSVKDYINLKPSLLYKYIGSLGLYRNKTKNIINAARRINDSFAGNVPNNMAGLVSLPGVGRKTANVVLANHFGKNHGIAIDTHCITVANRLRLVKTKNPVKIEKRMMELVNQKDWGNLTHLFISLGRDACTARVKYCSRCVLRDVCPSSTAR